MDLVIEKLKREYIATYKSICFDNKRIYYADMPRCMVKHFKSKRAKEAKYCFQLKETINILKERE